MFTPSDFIQKKRDGHELAPDEIKAFIHGLSNGVVADYQATAFLMAVYFKGMTLTETVALTQAMLESGEHYDLSHIPGLKVDKHSTGGVGVKVTLILAPLAAACGLKVPTMSGRGLGHSGGTLDKLESISGFKVNLDQSHFERALNRVGCAMIGQSQNMVPADKKLYALRDVTATVECIPLIVASILSKKIAEGTESLVLDVKVGSGAFMKSREQARRLAKTLVKVGVKLGLKCRALITNMDQPLGYAVGNSIEVLESIEVLAGKKFASFGEGSTCSSDLRELTLQLCAHMLETSGKSKNLAEGKKLAHKKLEDGSAYRTFVSLVQEQGGDLGQIHDPMTLPLSKRRMSWNAKRSGFITKMDTEAVGRILVNLGGGRKQASDRIDPQVGLIFHQKLGDRVYSGEPIATVLAPSGHDSAIREMEESFHQSVLISPSRKAVPKLIYEVLR